MALVVSVPENFGYAALVALGAVPILAFVQGGIVGRYRKAAKIPYPNPYASAEQAKSNRAAYQFNCAQRAHGNLMENLPQAMLTTLFSALFYPNAAALLSAGWVAGRALYAYGYITSQENGKGRNMGGIFWLCQIGLIGTSIAGALKLL